MTRTRQDIRAQREVAYWLALIELDEPTQADIARFQQWLSDDPANAAAYRELSGIWRDSGELHHLAKLERPQARHEAGSRNLRARARKMVRGHFVVPVAAVAGIALVLLGLALISERPYRQSPGGSYVTAVAEIRHLVLEDGSKVTLGPKSRLEVAYGEDERRVILSAGEAFFAVTPDPGRAFIVLAHDTRISVVGTSFNVHEGPRGLTVAVAEGTVEIVKPRKDSGPGEKVAVEDRRRLRAGQRVLASSTGGFQPVEAIPVGLPGAWRSGRLVYENSALSEVVADVNRYSATPIVIGSPELRDIRVFATFRTTEIDRMISGLEESLPVVADRSNPGRIVLRSKPGADR